VGPRRVREPFRPDVRVHLDTHVVLFLHDGAIHLLPPAARELLRVARPVVSPMVRVELSFLHEVGRSRYPAAQILDSLRQGVDLGEAEGSFERVAAIATTLGWTRDPFDRLIAAHALADDLPLLTRDRRLLAHCAVARWNG
jgi:PIN domain nuclease of toxin-antitoxin system